jgi:hypothetical protein
MLPGSADSQLPIFLDGSALELVKDLTQSHPACRAERRKVVAGMRPRSSQTRNLQT